MNHRILCLTAISGALAVAMGAFGSHALQVHLTERMSDVYDIANRYHFYHTFALLITASICDNTSKWTLRSIIAFFLGILIFSGSLYIMAISGWTTLGILTPFGGIALIAGWLFLAVGELQIKKSC